MFTCLVVPTVGARKSQVGATATVTTTLRKPNPSSEGFLILESHHASISR